MIRHFARRTAELDVHPADDRHVGEMLNKWRHCYVEGLREIGFSDFSGDMRMPGPQEGYHGVLVITSGSGELYEGDRVAHFEAGDVLVYDPPIGHQRIVSEGCTYVYMTQWENEEARAQLGLGSS